MMAAVVSVATTSKRWLLLYRWQPLRKDGCCCIGGNHFEKMAVVVSVGRILTTFYLKDMEAGYLAMT